MSDRSWDAEPDPDDERPVDPTDEEAAVTLPERLDVPLETPEADAVEQVLEVPIEDDEE
jgi:hypothetical protein